MSLSLATEAGPETSDSREKRQEALLDAAVTGQVYRVRELHREGADILAKDNQALREAAATGNLGVVRYLHHNGASIHSRDDEAVVLAAANGHLDVVRYLHWSGADIRTHNDDALRRAVAGGWVEVVRYLHHNGVPVIDFGAELLVTAAAAGHVNVVRYLHWNGADIRVGDDEPLRQALVNRQEEMIVYLKQNGSFIPSPGEMAPDIEWQYWGMLLPLVAGDVASIEKLYCAGILGDGRQAAILAAANGQIEILKFLHRSGVDVHAIAGEALPLAAANGRLSVIRYLHRQGCDICIGNNSPIRAAAEKAELRVLIYLHRNGAEIQACAQVAQASLLSSPGSALTISYLARNGVCPEGPAITNLLQAIRTGSRRQVKAQLSKVDISAHSKLVMSAATERDDPALIAMLHQSGCDIRAANDIAILGAAANGSIRVMRYLHQMGGNIRVENDLPLRLAAQNGHLRVIAWLLREGASINSIDQKTLILARCLNPLIFNYLTDSGADAIADERPTLEMMGDELAAADAIYRPSKLWHFFNEINLEQLRRGGMNGFKLTVNQNYFNFVPLSILDPQLRSLLRYWIRRPNWIFFDLAVGDPDVDSRSGHLVAYDRRIFRLAIRYPGVRVAARRLQMILYRWLVSMLWDYVLAHDNTGLSAMLSEPRLGSPIEIVHRGRLISQDLGHSILEYNVLASVLENTGRSCRLRIAEVGAGYGRLGYVLLKALSCQYVVFDIPPGLAVSQWYLSEAYPEKRVFRFRHIEHFEDVADELAAADIAFFTPNQIKLFPEGYFDLSVNISSLHELRLDQIENMLNEMYRVTSRFVYLKQYKKYINPFDKLVIPEESYHVARGWRTRIRRDLETDSRFFERVIEKESVRSAMPAQPVAPLKPASVDHAKSSLKTATVSVLLANYNHAQYLATALSGIVGQTHPATEVIVVDDGSTDDSVAVIEDFRRRHPNIRLLKNHTNRGQHYSIQRALLEAKGEYIVWAASDDLMLPRFLERSLAMLQEHPEAGLCFSRLSVFVDGASEVRHYIGYTHGAAFDYGDVPRYFSARELDAVLREHYVWISGNTVVVRRSALLELGGFEQSLRWHADWFTYYVVALRYGACVIPETLALMRERRGTYSGGGINNPAQQRKVIKAILDIIDSPKYWDIRLIFNRRPSLLSLFGKPGLYTAMLNPRHWRTAWSLACWHGPRYLHRRYVIFRKWLAAR